MEKQNKTKDILVKSLFILGIVIVVLALTFAVIKIMPRIFSSFANVGEVINSPFSNNSLELETDDNSVKSGKPTIISWDFTPEENGVYELEYKCESDLTIELGTSQGNKNIECNTIYNLKPQTQLISFVPEVAKENLLVNLKFTVRFINESGNIITKDDINMTVVNNSENERVGSGSIIDTEVITAGETVEEEEPRDDSTSNDTRVVSTINRIPDLRIYDVRAIDDSTVIFTISNIGNTATGDWFFNYVMPDKDRESSPIQNSLRPGEAIRFTLRLEDVPSGDLAIAVDPYNNIRESNILNNIVVIEIEGNDDGYSSDYDDNDDADLKIEDLEVGYMRGSRFIEDDEIDEDDTATIRFIVSNIGGESTGSWRFEVQNLPYDNDDDFESKRQDSLRPGESVEIMVEFENPDEGRYRIEVEVDSRDDVDEERESNNDDSRTLEVRE